MTRWFKYTHYLRIKRLSDDKMVQCTGESCSYVTCPVNNPKCGTEFSVMSKTRNIGSAVALTDQIYFELGGKALQVCQWTELLL